MVGEVMWVVLACVLRATTKKGQLFWGRKVHPRQILATPMATVYPVRGYGLPSSERQSCSCSTSFQQVTAQLIVSFCASLV